MTRELLTKEVAEIIKLNKEQGTAEEMVAIVASRSPIGYERYPELMKIGLTTLMNALVNGYEVDESPEDKVRRYYEEAERQTAEGTHQEARNNAFYRTVAVRATLDLLGIKYEGVNA